MQVRRASERFVLDYILLRVQHAHMASALCVLICPRVHCTDSTKHVHTSLTAMHLYALIRLVLLIIRPGVCHCTPRTLAPRVWRIGHCLAQLQEARVGPGASCRLPCASLG